MKTWKPRLAGLLAGLMLVSMLPTAALAAERPPDGDVPAIAEIGAKIGDDYVKAEPQQPQIAPMSMMPLEVERYDLDMTGYLPEELREVEIATVLENLDVWSSSSYPTENPEDVAVWAKWGYYDEDGDYVSENDDFYMVDDSLTLDLSSYSQYSRRVYLELIVGTADQLNLNNTRYIVDVELSSYDDLLTATAADAEGVPIDVYDTYLSENNRYGNIYQIGVDKNDWTSGEQASLTLALSTEFSGLTATAYEGYYESLEEIPADAVDITSQLMGTGYLEDYSYQSHYEGMPQVTLVLYRGEKLAFVLPLILYFYEDGLSISYSSDLYADQESGSSRRSVTDTTDYDYQEHNYPYYTITLDPGYPADGIYYYELTMYNPADPTVQNNGIAYVDKAVVGYYATADAIPEDAADIKAQLFSDAYTTGGYGADFSGGITFTIVDINGEIYWVGLRTVENQGEEELPPAPTPDSADTYFQMETAVSPDEGTYIQAYVMPYDADSYYYNGYQTVFLLNRNSQSSDVYAVSSDTVTPVFYTGNQVEMFAGHNGSSGVKQISGETPVEFISGEAIPYSAAAENGTDLKNYWVTFLTQQSGPKLFVNATNDESHYVVVDGEEIPQREVFLTDEYNNHHDVFFANIGDQNITGLYVRLENAQNVALDPYWTIGETTTLSAFTTTEQINSYGELANVAKIRLVPATDENGNVLAGTVSGTLVIGYTGGGTGPVEEVRISLTGVAGAPKITTETVVDGVQYVPYSSLIQTNNMYESDAVTFELTGGELPEGVIVKPNGEVYGVPTEYGEFTFTVTAVYRGDETLSDSKEFTLTILDNTNENVENATDTGYELLDRVPDTMDSYTDQVFRSNGEYGQFVDFWLDGEKLVEGEDYISEEGSTKITIQAQTFRNAGRGTHTLAAEFRTGGSENLDSELKRTAQNYSSTVSSGSGSSGNNSSDTTYPVTVSQPNFGTITVTPKNASKGDTVTITVQPEQGYQLESLKVTDNQGNAVELTEKNGAYTFVMPSGKVDIQGTFTPIEPPDGRTPFTDVHRSDWFADAVAFVYEEGLMAGTSVNAFSPNAATTRGMIVTILYQMEGRPESSDTYFADVPINQYYAQAASWAAEQGIVSGYGDGKFGPDDPITREQIVMILMQYIQYRQMDTSAHSDLSQFVDRDAIDQCALDAMAWANAEGLMNGKGSGVLDPKGPATRAEVAAILTQLCTLIQRADEG